MRPIKEKTSFLSLGGFQVTFYLARIFGTNFKIRKNPFSEDQIRKLTGMRTEYYWKLIDKLESAGESDGYKLNLPAKVLLCRMIIRKKMSITTMRTMFGLSRQQMSNIFKSVNLSHYSVANLGKDSN